MKIRETSLLRIFVLRLEDGDRLPDALETLARDKKISSALCLFLGGIRSGSRLVEGPRGGDLPPDPMVRALSGVHEIMGLGTIFPDAKGRPVLHAHASAGRDGRAETGCIRPGIETWHVLEAVVLEMADVGGRRLRDSATGFDLLDFSEEGTTDGNGKH
ncbi:MAG: DNA-binding protein [Spirochaetales bacterium]|nr:DNA-binding protein [Spirochaetales bacterium]